MRVFITRADFARRFGIYGASELRLGSVSGNPLPLKTRIACMVDGELKEARAGEEAHWHIIQRESIPGSDVVEGFSYEEIKCKH